MGSSRELTSCGQAGVESVNLVQYDQQGSARLLSTGYLFPVGMVTGRLDRLINLTRDPAGKNRSKKLEYRPPPCNSIGASATASTLNCDQGVEDGMSYLDGLERKKDIHNIVDGGLQFAEYH